MFAFDNDHAYAVARDDYIVLLLGTARPNPPQNRSFTVPGGPRWVACSGSVSIWFMQTLAVNTDQSAAERAHAPPLHELEDSSRARF